jgi:C4-dicarboxylate-specific signal transduction histidine kinase
MSPENARLAAGQTRRLLWPLVGMFLLSVALQVASLMAMLQIDASVARSRRQVAAAAGQLSLVEQFENTTYLALVGLATSDWEVLLPQRRSAQELSGRFIAVNEAMLHGGRVRLEGDVEVALAGLKEAQFQQALASVQALWANVFASHTRVLRSQNHSLKQNPDLEQFRADSRLLRQALGEFSALLHHRAQAEMHQLSRIQRLIPVGAFLLTLGIFAYVLWRILLPFAASTEELARSEGALRSARDELEQRVAERTEALARANEALRHAHDDLEVRVKERTQELKEAQRRAVDLARQAGMAELATNVLHNVGNVLNSLNTASTVLNERLRTLRVEPLLKLASSVEEHRENLAAYLSADGPGRRLPEYLGKLGQHLATQRDQMLELTGDLHRYVEHIRMIVELQQTYATTSSLVEAASLEELVEDALRISEPALGRHGVTLERHILPLPRQMLDRHKLLQIVLNLISNAKYALNDKPAGERRLTLRIDRPAEDRVRLQVSDNGMGIAPELLTKIFQHGFTTRKEGHGFGLHSCALSAQALGGSLRAHSDGPGKGATFTLELPFQPEATERARTGS